MKVDQYAKAGIPFYRRVEQSVTGLPLVYTYLLDPAGRVYRDGDVFTGVVKAAVPSRWRSTSAHSDGSHGTRRRVGVCVRSRFG